MNLARITRIIVGAFLLLCLFAILKLAWSYRPYPQIDRSKVYPPLVALQEPLIIKTYYYWDGGTIGIRIQDAQQTELLLSFPSEFLRESKYTKLFVGALYKRTPSLKDRHRRGPPMTEITPMEPTAEYLRQLLRSQADDPTIAYALSRLSDRQHEKLRPLADRFIHGKSPKSYLY